MCGFVTIRILMDLTCFVRSQCAINPMISNVKSRTIPMFHIFAKSIILWLWCCDSDGLKMAIEPEARPKRRRDQLASNGTHARLRMRLVIQVSQTRIFAMDAITVIHSPKVLGSHASPWLLRK
ncbi:hypothetical protein BS47DRAFT_1412100 [Hydnum rufescens UP504]|uniref:Uncharacterized protein n=1 Tax=Hydnum rufescens UP504 TaxID=1448309 RepID=A0A9P6DSI6_9AGAM|nr:hypothetical protein BS47DRAFT_1412100 [Hydnum rufescens UP504]